MDDEILSMFSVLRQRYRYCQLCFVPHEDIDFVLDPAPAAQSGRKQHSILTPLESRFSVKNLSTNPSVKLTGSVSLSVKLTGSDYNLSVKLTGSDYSVYQDNWVRQLVKLTGSVSCVC